MIEFVALNEVRSGLFESKRKPYYIYFITDLHHPIKITGAGIATGPSAGNHMIYPFFSQGLKSIVSNIGHK